MINWINQSIRNVWKLFHPNEDWSLKTAPTPHYYNYVIQLYMETPNLYFKSIQHAFIELSSLDYVYWKKHNSTNPHRISESALKTWAPGSGNVQQFVRFFHICPPLPLTLPDYPSQPSCRFTAKNGDDAIEGWKNMGELNFHQEDKQPLAKMHLNLSLQGPATMVRSFHIICPTPPLFPGNKPSSTISKLFPLILQNLIHTILSLGACTTHFIFHVSTSFYKN